MSIMDQFVNNSDNVVWGFARKGYDDLAIAKMTGMTRANVKKALARMPQAAKPKLAEAAVDNGKHHCHARGCRVATKPEYLMCFKHWKMVPSDLQQAVWQTYRPGQCDDKQPSEAWHKAADAAIASVFRQEQGHGRRTGPDSENESQPPAIAQVR